MQLIGVFDGVFLQYFATLSGCFSAITSGINLGWTSPYLPDLLSLNSTIPTTSSEGSWCAVMPLVGAPPGAILAAIFVDRLGRKPTTLIMAPITVACFITMAYAPSILILSIARFVIGSIEGGLYTVLPMYVAEIAEPQIRGFLSSTISVAAIFGTIFINLIGPFSSIRTSSLISAIVPFMHFVTFLWMPESPYYLIKKGRFCEAEESLKKLRYPRDISVEIKELRDAVARQEAGSPGTFWDLFSVESNRRAVIIYTILCLTNKFSGKNPLIFYSTMIFQSAGGSLNPTASAITYVSVEMVSTIVALSLIDRLGRRPLLIFSAAGCSISLLFEAIYFVLKHNSSPLLEYLGWLPITALVSYNVIFSMGLAYGPVLLLGEMFPTNVKAAALCAGDTMSVLMGTVASQFFHVTMEMFGIYVPFFAFACFSCLGAVLIWKFLLETKGKTLEDIQMYFINKC